MPHHVFGEVEVPLERPDLVRLQAEVGHGVEAFGEAADLVGEAATAPLVDVLDGATAVLDELAHTIDGAREAFIAHVRADNHNKLVVSQQFLSWDKTKRPRGRPSTALRHSRLHRALRPGPPVTGRGDYSTWQEARSKRSAVRGR